MYHHFIYTANLDIILDPFTDELHVYMVLQRVGREDLTPLQRSLESLEAILDLEVFSVGRSGITPRMTSAISACTFSDISLSSQPVVILLFWYSSVSKSLLRYSTVVLKYPRIESSFSAIARFPKSIINFN